MYCPSKSVTWTTLEVNFSSDANPLPGGVEEVLYYRGKVSKLVKTKWQCGANLTHSSACQLTGPASTFVGSWYPVCTPVQARLLTLLQIWVSCEELCFHKTDLTCLDTLSLCLVWGFGWGVLDFIAQTLNRRSTCFPNTHTHTPPDCTLWKTKLSCPISILLTSSWLILISWRWHDQVSPQRIPLLGDFNITSLNTIWLIDCRHHFISTCRSDRFTFLHILRTFTQEWFGQT